MRLSKIFAAVAFLAASSASFATTVTLTEVGYDPHVAPASSPVVTINGGATSSNVTTREFYVIDSHGSSFATFCLELGQSYFGNPPGIQTETFTVDVPHAFTAGQKDSLSKLFTGAGWKSWDYTNDAVDQDFEKVGLQLAVWDIMEDAGGALDLGSTGFQVLDDSYGGAAVSFANASFAAGNLSMVSSLMRLNHPTAQDLVIAVPEPSTYAMLIAGLAGIGFVARRRQPKRG